MLAGVFLLAAACQKEPTIQNESKTQKYREVIASFTGEVTDDGGEHAASIKQFFDDFGSALRERKASRISQLFDCRMTISLLDQQGMVPKAIRRKQGELVEGMQKEVSKRLSDPITGLAWVRYEIRQVRFIQDETEALVYARHWDADDISSKRRWWLFQEDGTWRAYDFEDLQTSIRFSTSMGIGLKMADANDPSVRQFPKLMAGMQQMQMGEVDEALQTFEQLDGVDFPPVIESLRLMLVAALHNQRLEYEEALNAAKRALALNRELPLMHLICACASNGLGQFEQAKEHTNRYAEFLGKDADYYAAVGET